MGAWMYTGYTGIHCELDVADPCSNVTCENNGTCQSQTTDQFQCDCILGKYIPYYTSVKLKLVVLAT